MKKNIFLLVVLLSIIFTSCMDNMLYGLYFKSHEDPDVSSELFADSFEKQNHVLLKWEKDDACDLYEIERYVGSSGKVIYKGTDCEFDDDLTNEVDENQVCVYKMNKYRGKANKKFPCSKTAIGVRSTIIHDSYEKNNTVESAVKLASYPFECNLYRLINSNQKQEDVDWFYVDVDPQWTCEVVIVQNELLGLETDLRYTQYGLDSKDVINNSSIKFANSLNEVRRVYFSVELKQNIGSALSSFFSRNYIIKINNIKYGVD